MIRVVARLILLAFIALGSVVGCGGSGGGDDDNDGHSCDLGFESTETICTASEVVGECETSNFTPDPDPNNLGICVATNCLDCLCNVADVTINDVATEDDCESISDNDAGNICPGLGDICGAGVIGDNFDYNFDTNECTVFNCLQQLPCAGAQPPNPPLSPECGG